MTPPILTLKYIKITSNLKWLNLTRLLEFLISPSCLIEI